MSVPLQAVQIEALDKVRADQANEICELASAGGFKIVAPEGATPLHFLGTLLAEERLEEAVQFLAFALPQREAVWWACTCARLELREPVPQAELDAVEAAETWVRRPTDDNRREAMERAQATSFDVPAAWAAVAAFWSGGSLAPPNVPEVPVAPHLIGVAVAGAVSLAAVQTEPEHAQKKRERFLTVAVDIANGGSGRPQTGGG